MSRYKCHCFQPATRIVVVKTKAGSMVERLCSTCEPITEGPVTSDKIMKL